MARFIDAATFGLYLKSKEELLALRPTYASELQRLRLRLVWCWVRNRLGSIVLFVAFGSFAMFGFVASSRGNEEIRVVDWVVGIGWFGGALYVGTKWRWLDQTAKAWEREEKELREEVDMHRDTVSDIDRNIKRREAGE